MRDHFSNAKNIRRTWWRFLLLSSPVVGLMVLGNYFLLQSERQAKLATVRMETAHHIESQAKNVRMEIKQAVLHVKFLANHSEVKSVLRGDDERALKELNHDFNVFSRQMGVYDQVRLLDRHGREIVRANFSNAQTLMTAAADLQDKRQHAYFWKTMTMPDQSVFISKFTLNVEHGHIEYPLKAVIRFAAPIIGADGEKLGVVVLNFLGKVLIDRYLDATDVRGENMLLDANGFFFHAADENSLWGSVLEEREGHNLASRFPHTWDIIVDQRNGQVLTEQGLFTFATVSPYALIGQSEPQDSGAGDWIVVSYVSCDALHEGGGSISRLFMGSSLFLLLLWLVLVWLWARSEIQREQLLAEKQHLLRLQMGAQETERHELARSLHDDMGQSLTSIQTYAAVIAKSELDEKAHDGVQQIRQITRHIQHSVHNQLQGLRPASLDRLGLCASLEGMLEQFSQRESVIGDFVCLQPSVALSDEQNIHLYRIVQEALTNVAKYSQAKHVYVNLYVKGDDLYLSICDDGCGMDMGKGVTKETGLGLLGMRERTELLHGSIRIESAQAKGVSIYVTIPLEKKTIVQKIKV